MPHMACKACGRYNGKVVIDITSRAARDARRKTRRDKELRASGHAREADKAEQETAAPSLSK